MMLDKKLKKQYQDRIYKKYHNPDQIKRGLQKLRAWLWTHQPPGSDGPQHTEWIEYMQMYTVMADMLRKQKIEEEEAWKYHGNEELEVYEQQFILAYPDLNAV